MKIPNRNILVVLLLLFSCEKIELLDRTNNFVGVPDNGSIPIVNTISSNNISNNSANLKGEIIFDEDSITQHGHCWSLNNNPSLNNGWCTLLESPESSIFHSIASNLISSTNYYYVAYATNVYGISYGEVEAFQTSTNSTIIYGCTDSTATNYYPLATEDNGSCEYLEDIYGCTDPTATNYNTLATIDDGSCEYFEDINGCTDPTATNYNPMASVDDGSCEYSCTNVVITVSPGSYPDEISWEFSGYTGGVGSTNACIENGCHIFNLYDTYGDGWNAASVSITNEFGSYFVQNGGLTFNSGYEESILIAVNETCNGDINFDECDCDVYQPLYDDFGNVNQCWNVCNCGIITSSTATGMDVTFSNLVGGSIVSNSLINIIFYFFVNQVESIALYKNEIYMGNWDDDLTFNGFSSSFLVPQNYTGTCFTIRVVYDGHLYVSEPFIIE
jgi:hypothetical protein